MDAQGQVVAQYDKHHLVPFGEYIPLRHLPGIAGLIKNIAGDMGDFSRGPGPQTLVIGPYPPFSPLVCYEAIFPEEATDGTQRAQWLFSLTDDAWFGISSGPLQDVQMARMRAVEQGVPLLRAANTGVSAAFDAYGRTIAVLPLEKEGVMDLYLPKVAMQVSIVSRYPESWVLLVIIMSTGFLFLCSKKPRQDL
jgi:apolipoprotein N-acyltransferase